MDITILSTKAAMPHLQYYKLNTKMVFVDNVDAIIRDYSLVVFLDVNKKMFIKNKGQIIGRNRNIACWAFNNEKDITEWILKWK